MTNDSLCDFRMLMVSRMRAVLLLLCVTVCVGCQTVQSHLIPAVEGQGFPGCGFRGVKDDADCAQLAGTSKCKSYEFVPFNEFQKPPACKAFECEGLTGASPPQPHVSATKYCSEYILFGDFASVDPQHDAESAKPALQSDNRFDQEALKRTAAADAVVITEFALPRAGILPGPIITAGQRLVFGSVATPCDGPCDIYQADTQGRVTALGVTCGSPSNCRHSGLAPTADGGFCYTTVNDRYPAGPPNNGAGKPDEIVCVLADGTVRKHMLDILTGFVGGLALASDGRILYTESQWNGIGRIDVNDTTSLRASYFKANHVGFASIAEGRDRSIWFTVVKTGAIGLLDSSGLQFFRPPTRFSDPAGITAGPDGNMWFTEVTGNKIGRITPAGVVTEFPLPTAGAHPLGIAAGPDGALWFTEFTANKIGRITVFGDITEYPIPTANSNPMGIVAGPDGNMWFTELGGNKLGKVSLPTATLPQVVEFYNTNHDRFFITATAAEQAAIDGGAAGPGWVRTSSTFPSGGSSTVCRFYGSISPGPNSHFYTADTDECAALKALQATTPATQKRWNFESNDFNTTPAVNGACAAGLTRVYRAYNNGFARGIDSNHRITPSANAIADVVSRGWLNEGVVMCAP